MEIMLHRENVIRNQLEIDEGDPFNEILFNKSINNIKSLNFFKNVNQVFKMVKT
jgi:outer membrane protein insertion porin family